MDPGQTARAGWNTRLDYFRIGTMTAYQEFIHRGAFGTVRWAEYDRELLHIYSNDGLGHDEM